MNGAESLARTLVGSGVEVCFANPGTSEMHFVAALDEVEGLRCVLGLFEGVVTGAADGYARMAGKPPLTLPADASWEPADGPAPVAPVEGRAAVSSEAIEAAARALRSGKPAVLFLGGPALREPGLTLAGRISARTGARLVAQTHNGRVERGARRVAPEFFPYPVDEAIATLAGTRHLLLVGAKAPVAFFAYPGKPSALSPEGCEARTLATPEQDVVAALEALADELDAREDAPVQAPEAPAPGDGPLRHGNAAAAVAAPLPEEANVVDEALTGAAAFLSGTRGAASHDYLQITGGAIGIGLPLATGAAVACPDRKVVCLQADGSAMYTVQAMWTQARENLDVT